MRSNQKQMRTVFLASVLVALSILLANQNAGLARSEQNAASATQGDTWTLVQPAPSQGDPNRSISVSNSPINISMRFVTTRANLVSIKDSLVGGYLIQSLTQSHPVSVEVLSPTTLLITATQVSLETLPTKETTVTVDLVGGPNGDTFTANHTFVVIRQAQAQNGYLPFVLNKLPTPTRTPTPVPTATPNPCANDASDWCEPNNSVATAFGGVPFNMAIHPTVNLNTDRRDTYKFRFTDSTPYVIGLTFPAQKGDLDLYLYDINSPTVAKCKSDQTGTSSESITFSANQAPCNVPPGEYAVLVYVFSSVSAGDNIQYTLTVQH